MPLSKNTYFRFALLFVADGLLLAIGALLWLVFTLPRIPENLETLSTQTGINIYAQSGELLYTFNQRVKQVTLDEVSPTFVQAVLATEDLDFYNHHGYSLKAIAGAFLDNLKSLRKTRGGSTLTQQIVKNLFLTREKSYIRKVKELLLATQLETMFKRRYGPSYKDKLLELYINGSFYGTNAYGVEDAAQTYFGKSAKTLTLLEAALLAGLPNAPSVLSPYRQDPSKIANRVAHVLNRMTAAGWITQTDREAALKGTFAFNTDRAPQNRTPYFVETIKAEITRLWGTSTLSFGGLDVHTTLDLSMQQAAEQAVAEGLTDLDIRLGFPDYKTASETDRKDYVQAALLCLAPATGHVKAMVGGRDIFVSYFNRATQARRQPGSGFKPIAYLTAFASNQITPLSLFIDEPRTYIVNNKPWGPKNFRNSYLGLTTAARALIRSANATSVQIVQHIGPQQVVEMGKRLGIQSPLGPYPSIALGSSEVTLLDMTTAYGTIANYGIRITPTFITAIEDSEGRTLYRHRPDPAPVLDPTHAYTMIQLLQHVVDRGTGRRVRTTGLQGPAAGKTGTTNDNTDAWFTGFTPDYTASVWIGFDSREGKRKLIEKKTRRQITGGSGAATIWTTFMKTVAPDNVSKTFFTPEGIQTLTIDARTGLPIHPEHPDTLAIPITLAVPQNIQPNTQEEVDQAGSQRAAEPTPSTTPNAEGRRATP